MDMLEGPYWYNLIFNFRYSGPYNSKFYDFGMSDLNFYNNSGSIFIIFVFILLNAAFWNLVIRLSKRYYKNPWMRRLGMFANDGTSIRGPLLLMIIEGYTDLILSGFIGVYEIMYSFSSWELFKNLFADFSNTLLTVTTLITTAFMVYLPFYVKRNLDKNFENLDKEEALKELKVFYGDYKIENRNQALYGYYQMVRKIILVLILILLDDYPWAQGILIMINTTFFLFLLIVVKPYSSRFM